AVRASSRGSWRWSKSRWRHSSPASACRRTSRSSACSRISAHFVWLPAVIGFRSRLRCKRGNILDEPDLFVAQLEIVDRQIFAHVIRARGAGQRQDSNLTREPKHHLRGRASDSAGDFAKRRMAQFDDIRGEKREALIRDAVLATKRAHVNVPPEAREAAILHERWLYISEGPQFFELIDGDVADAEVAGFADGVQVLHRAPHFVIDCAESATSRRAVQQVRIDRFDLQMFERAGDRLLDLGRRIGVRIVRQPVILSRRIRELCLQEELLAPNNTHANRMRDGGAGTRFEVMPPLIRRVDRAEAGFNRTPREIFRRVLFPRRAVEECRLIHFSHIARSFAASDVPSWIGNNATALFLRITAYLAA